MLGGRKVNRCFKAFERFVARRADKATRVLGPLFLALAVGLISLSAFCFFEARPCPALSVGPLLELASDAFPTPQAVFPEVFLSAEVPRWQRVLGTTWCSYLVLMMAFHVRTLVSTLKVAR